MATASVEAISRELALPLDDILSDATTVLDRYAGHDEDIIARLATCSIVPERSAGMIQKVGSSIVPETARTRRPGRPVASGLGSWWSTPTRRSAGRPSPARRSGRHVETARDATEAVALARQTPYSAGLWTSACPTCDGYETFKAPRGPARGPDHPDDRLRLRPSHSIVKARQEGFKRVLYKPFPADRLMEAVEQALQHAAGGAKEAGAASGNDGYRETARPAGQGTPP